jgi:hypothetical protein
LWQRAFASDPQVVGRAIKLNGHLYTIVGVAPRSFSGLELSYRPDIYVPAMMIGDIVPAAGSQLLASRHSRSFIVGKNPLEGAIGHALRHRGNDQVPIRIVGIMKDSIYGTVTPLGSAPAPVFYIPVLQYTDSNLALQVRTEGGVEGIGAAVLQQIRSLDPEIAPIYSGCTASSPIRSSVRRRKLASGSTFRCG